MSMITPSRSDWVDTIQAPYFVAPINGTAATIVGGARGDLPNQLGSVSGAQTLTYQMTGTSLMTMTPTGATTLNAPQVLAEPIGYEWTVAIISNGTPTTVTFGTNFISNGPVLSSSTAGGVTAVKFVSNSLGANIGQWTEVGRNTYGASANPLLYSHAGTQLPACGSSNLGAVASVSDAAAVTYGNTYTPGAGAGTATVPVFCNGTNWIIH